MANYDGSFNITELNRMPVNAKLVNATGETIDLSWWASLLPGDIDEAASSVTYIGRMDSEGVWCIMKIDEGSNPASYRFASELNNSSYTTYASAFTDRASLIYGYYYEVI